jgi:hypothetical protein
MIGYVNQDSGRPLIKPMPKEKCSGVEQQVETFGRQLRDRPPDVILNAAIGIEMPSWQDALRRSLVTVSGEGVPGDSSE